MNERFSNLSAVNPVQSEIVRLYLRHTDLLQNPQLPSGNRERLQRQRLEMLEIMSPQERIELAEYGREMAKRIRDKTSITDSSKIK